jgi:hypothetical protein
MRERSTLPRSTSSNGTVEFFPRRVPTLRGLDALEPKSGLAPTTSAYRPQAVTVRVEADPELVAATVPSSRNTISLWRSEDRPLLAPSVGAPSPLRLWLAGAFACVGFGLALFATFMLGRAGSFPAEVVRANVTLPSPEPAIAPEPAAREPAAREPAAREPAVVFETAKTPEAPVPTPLVIDVPVVSARAPALANRAQRPAKPAIEGNAESVQAPARPAPQVPVDDKDKANGPNPHLDAHELSARAAAALESSLE